MPIPTQRRPAPACTRPAGHKLRPHAAWPCAAPSCSRLALHAPGMPCRRMPTTGASPATGRRPPRGPCPVFLPAPRLPPALPRRLPKQGEEASWPRPPPARRAISPHLTKAPFKARPPLLRAPAGVKDVLLVGVNLPVPRLGYLGVADAPRTTVVRARFQLPAWPVRARTPACLLPRATSFVARAAARRAPPAALAGAQPQRPARAQAQGPKGPVAAASPAACRGGPYAWEARGAPSLLVPAPRLLALPVPERLRPLQPPTDPNCFFPAPALPVLQRFSGTLPER